MLLSLITYCLDIQGQIRSCASDQIHTEILLNDPQYKFNRTKIENQAKKYNSTLQLRFTKIRIPVIVHVLYNSEVENISDTLIYSQIAALNRDFGTLLNTNYSTAATTKIEFVLATADPTGFKTNGITRTKTSNKSFQTGSSIMYANQGGKDAWPVNQYLNIWVGNVAGVLGYAYMPGTMHDGVVINYRYFGINNKPPFHLGRTVTHEVGHWLNLYHTWGLSTGCDADDEVEDTPNSAEPNFGCKLEHQSCGGMDMVENFMDYSDDACMNLFTKGQVNRMESLFTPDGFRHSLLSSHGLDEGIQEPCSNLIKDNGETGVDCGGSCLPCPTCTDQIKNGNETDVDCGGDCRPCGCKSIGQYSSMDYIESIKINDSISATADNGGYYFNTKKYFGLYTNVHNRIELTPGKSENVGQHFWNIWIDWNKDGMYAGESERVYSTAALGKLSDTFALGIPFPFEIDEHDTFPIRIQMKWGDHLVSGCDTFDFGEVEDYNVLFTKKYIDPCNNGVQDENETGIDCGPYCTPCAVAYCLSSGSNSRYEYIKRITWNGTPYTTGNNNGYRDFTESIITVSESRIINYQLEAGFAGNYVLTEYWMIYADWNKDGDFEDEGENVLKSTSAIPLTGSFTIPQQVKGKIRIRVIMTDAGNTKSCGKYAFGETEDYMLEIEEVQLKKSIPATAAGFTLYPVPADQYFFIQSTTGSQIKELVIRNFLGQVIHRESITSELVKLNCSHLVAGNYVITIYTDKRETYQSKITIAH